MYKSFFWCGRWDLLRNPTGAGVSYAFFCAANAVDTPGTKNSALCCFLNVPFKSLAPLQKKDLHNECTSHFLLVRSTASEGQSSACI